MSTLGFDPERLSVEERLALTLEAELVTELHRRVEDFKRDRSKSIRWEDLRAELRQKYG